MKKSGRGLGYFGDAKDRIEQFEKDKDFQKNFEVSKLERLSDANGQVRFLNIPVGKYTVEIEGNDIY